MSKSSKKWTLWKWITFKLNEGTWNQEPSGHLRSPTPCFLSRAHSPLNDREFLKIISPKDVSLAQEVVLPKPCLISCFSRFFPCLVYCPEKEPSRVTMGCPGAVAFTFLTFSSFCSDFLKPFWSDFWAKLCELKSMAQPLRFPEVSSMAREPASSGSNHVPQKKHTSSSDVWSESNLRGYGSIWWAFKGQGV